jgi:hypothetical protein
VSDSQSAVQVLNGTSPREEMIPPPLSRDYTSLLESR